ncbi:unnamed protein product [Diabrotica balteata]|uniref:Growth arrest-specific protein 8 n=1 Tax=Diabrotica balteata TaxID=107213 RepID=A0A9N9XAP3_DIABA|nr:unnamed protein product [Diabrotica balteata]
MRRSKQILELALKQAKEDSYEGENEDVSCIFDDPSSDEYVPDSDIVSDSEDNGDDDYTRCARISSSRRFLSCRDKTNFLESPSTSTNSTAKIHPQSDAESDVLKNIFKMPPKKGGGPKIIDGVDTASMTREQLEAFALRIKEENDREREERNFFQMERDKIRTFWEITRNELEEARAQVRNKDRALEEGVEKNEEELKFFKQKVKHLQYEHQNNLTECKAESLVALKQAQDEHAVQERELLEDKKSLKALMREQELSNQEQIKSLKFKTVKKLVKLEANLKLEPKKWK